jgi:hypothetical protein
MHFMILILISDFMQALNSRIKHYIKRKIFLKYILFSTIYLLYEYKLNHKNCSDQEINMSSFVQANEYDMHIYVKFQDVCKYRYVYTILTLFYLFSIYIIYYYETKLI